MICTTYDLSYHLTMEKLQTTRLHPVILSSFSVSTLAMFISTPCDNIMRRNYDSVILSTRHSLYIPSIQQFNSSWDIPHPCFWTTRGSQLPFIIVSPCINLALHKFLIDSLIVAISFAYIIVLMPSLHE